MKNKKRITIDRFDNFSDSNIKCESFYNYSPKEKLKNSKGIKVAQFPMSRSNPALYSFSGQTNLYGLGFAKQYHISSSATDYRLFVYTTDNKILTHYLIDDDNSFSWIYNLTYHSIPNVLSFKQNGADAIMLADDQRIMIWKTMRVPEYLTNVPIITSMCIDDNILYCTIADPAFKIWYTTDLDAENIGDIGKHRGYISLEDDLGDSRKILSYDGNIYVIRDYGISKITKIKDEILITDIYRSNTKIQSNTVAVCGGLLWFMTKHGLYTFNGIKVNKSQIDFSSMLSGDNEGATSGSLGNELYLALKLDFGDNASVLCENENYINNALVVIDTSTNTYQMLRGVDINCLLPVKTPVFEKMLCTFNTVNQNQIGEICDSSIAISDNLPKFWASGRLNDDHNSKIVTELVAYADAGVTFSLVCDNKTLTFTTSKSGCNKFAFKHYCKDFKLLISSNALSASVDKVDIGFYEN